MVTLLIDFLNYYVGTTSEFLKYTVEHFKTKIANSNQSCSGYNS